MAPDVYARWRAQVRRAALREEHGAPEPPERLLQAVWWHQRLRREALRLTDGRRLRVLHPGFWNHGAGPDFQRAAVQFEDEPPCFGDVEVDLRPAAWRAHGHDRNAAFAGVVLHVVWRGDQTRVPAVPTLELADVLDAPWEQLDDALNGGAAGEDFPQTVRGRCSAPLRELPEAAVRGLLRQAARVRLEMRSSAMTARARLVGWEQALWEGMFTALGYRHNVWPLRRLAELLPVLEAARAGGNVAVWQARLLGLAGLLPEELPRGRPGAGYVRGLWDHWWREREAFSGLVLPRKLWRLQGLRPANHPVRRLALAAHWLARGDLPARLERWFQDQPGPRRPWEALQPLLNGGGDPFWSWYLSWTSRRASQPRALLGAARTSDLAVNVVLPWLHARATMGRRQVETARVAQWYLDWPAGEDNAVLKEARQRLLGARPAADRLLSGAAEQQGLLQVVRDFCAASNSLCEGCRFPDLVRQAAAGETG
jgi:hypothetical protein